MNKIKNETYHYLGYRDCEKDCPVQDQKLRYILKDHRQSTSGEATSEGVLKREMVVL